MKAESIAECSLSDNWSWKSFLVFFSSGRLRQGLLYFDSNNLNVAEKVVAPPYTYTHNT